MEQDSLKTLECKHVQLESDYQSVLKNYELLNKKYLEIEKKYTETEKQANQMTAKYGQYKQMYTDIEKSFNDLNSEYEYIQKKYYSLKKRNDDLLEDKKAYKNQLVDAEASISALSSDLENALQINEIQKEKLDSAETEIEHLKAKFYSLSEQVVKSVEETTKMRALERENELLLKNNNSNAVMLQMEERLINLLNKKSDEHKKIEMLVNLLESTFVNRLDILELSQMFNKEKNDVSEKIHTHRDIEVIKQRNFDNRMKMIAQIYGENENNDSNSSEIIIESMSTRVETVYRNNCIPIVLACSDSYAPFCGIALKSILGNCSDKFNYDILILCTDDLSKRNKARISAMQTAPNISIRFLNVKEILSDWNLYKYGHFTNDVYSRILLVSPIFENYKKVIFLDSDILCVEDISKLWMQVDLKDKCIAACEDQFMKYLVKSEKVNELSGKIWTYKGYLEEVLDLENPDEYFNTGVLVLNLEEIRNKKFFDIWKDGLNEKAYMYFEQDMLNRFFKGDYEKIDMKWNNQMPERTYVNYHEIVDGVDVSRKCIMHFCGGKKPWLNLSDSDSKLYMSYAKQTPWYKEIILALNLCEQYQE